MVKNVKLSDLWQGVDAAVGQKTEASLKYAIIESQKILESTLKSQGYSGKTVKKKLFWAGYSLEDKEGMADALEKHEKILKEFDFQLTDIEVEEIVKLYKKIVQEIVGKEKYSFSDRMHVFYKEYMHPKSLLFWRNIAIIFGIFGVIKLLAYTEIGKNIIEFIINLSDMALSWVFAVIVIVFTIIVLALNYYFENRTHVKIKS